MISPETVVEMFSSRGVTSSHYKGSPCLIVEGSITTYIIMLDSHDVHDARTGKYISIAKLDNDHNVDPFSLTLALINDNITRQKISTLQHLHDKYNSNPIASP